MRKKRRKCMIQTEINVVPFLDVLLVLLIIFMIIPSKLIQGFEVNLPNSIKATDMLNNKNKSLITIEITETGLYNIIQNNEYIKSIHLNQLYSKISNTKKIHPDTVCLIAASKTIKYDEVIQILNLLNNIGVHSVGMMTDPICSNV